MLVDLATAISIRRITSRWPATWASIAVVREAHYDNTLPRQITIGQQAWERAYAAVNIWGGEPCVTAFEFDESLMNAEEMKVLLKLKLTEELAAILVEERGLSIEDAFAVLYRWQTYARLSDPATKLYYQSAGYVYSLLEDELSGSR